LTVRLATTFTGYHSTGFHFVGICHGPRACSYIVSYKPTSADVIITVTADMLDKTETEYRIDTPHITNVKPINKFLKSSSFLMLQILFKRHIVCVTFTHHSSA
jgi:hypothetical protein